MHSRSAIAPPLRLRATALVAAACVGGALTAAVLGDIPRNRDGWSVFTPSPDTRQIYVSDSIGNDLNSGLDIDHPVRTLARGQSLLRDSEPDWLLLKRGDTWVNQNLGDWTKSGRSADEPMLISGYGTGARPLLQTGSTNGITMWQDGVDYSNLAIVGLHFQANSNNGLNGPHGIRVDRPGRNLLIEDVELELYATNIVVQSLDASRPFENLAIRRSAIHHAFAQHTGVPGGSHSQGVYASNVHGILIEENVLDHNGYQPSMVNADATMFNHNLYIQTDNDDLVVRGNIIARAAAHGLQARPGGLVEGNLFLENSMAFFIAGEGGSSIDNVVLHGSTRLLLPDGQPRAWGIDMKDIAGSRAEGNIVAHTPGGTEPLVGLAGVIVDGNVVYRWGDNTWPGQYFDPERTMITYNAWIGDEGDLESFLDRARQLSPENYDLRYTAGGAIPYFQAGFGQAVPEPAAALLLAPCMLLMRRSRRRM